LANDLTMKSLFNFLFLFISLSSCTNSLKYSYQVKVDVFFNKKHVESRYIDTQNHIAHIVTFDTSNLLPIDSVLLFYVHNDKTADSIRVYTFSKRKFKYVHNPVMENIYYNLYHYKESLDTLYLDLLNDLCLEEDLYSINNILNSPLPIENKPKFTVSDSSGFRVIKYNGINAIFRNHPLFIQSCFYNQKLYALEVKVNNNAIAECSYLFQEGELNINYHYINEMIDKKIITCKYRDGTESVNVYDYVITYP